MKQEFYGVFVRGRTDNPVAIFGDADLAQRTRRAEYGDQAAVLPIEATISEASLKDAHETFAALAPTVAPTDTVPPSDPDADMKGRIRAQLEEEERRARLTEEVKHEMASDKRADKAPAAATAPTASRAGG